MDGIIRIPKYSPIYHKKRSTPNRKRSVTKRKKSVTKRKKSTPNRKRSTPNRKRSVSKRKKIHPKTSDLTKDPKLSPNAKFLSDNLYALSIANKYASEHNKKDKFGKCSKKEDCKGQLVCVSEMCVSPENIKVAKIQVEDLLKYMLS